MPELLGDLHKKYDAIIDEIKENAPYSELR